MGYGGTQPVTHLAQRPATVALAVAQRLSHRVQKLYAFELLIPTAPMRRYCNSLYPPLMPFAALLLRALSSHWPYYLMEAAGLMAFIIFSGVATVMCLHPDSAVARALGPHKWVQRMGWDW